MKLLFEEPSLKVVRFNDDVITASGCGCNVGGVDFTPFGGNSTPDDCPHNHPECYCSYDEGHNCA